MYRVSKDVEKQTSRSVEIFLFPLFTVVYPCPTYDATQLQCFNCFQHKSMRLKDPESLRSFWPGFQGELEVFTQNS